MTTKRLFMTAIGLLAAACTAEPDRRPSLSPATDGKADDASADPSCPPDGEPAADCRAADERVIECMESMTCAEPDLDVATARTHATCCDCNPGLESCEILSDECLQFEQVLSTFACPDIDDPPTKEQLVECVEASDPEVGEFADFCCAFSSLDPYAFCPVTNCRNNNMCSATQYCEFSATAQCGAADAPGTCAPRPDACDTGGPTVCGCDGQSHPSACEAAALGVSVLHVGPC